MFRSKRNGITLVEVLVALAILVIVIGLLIPARRNIPEAANRMKCSNNLKQLMLGFQQYESHNQSNGATEQVFPPGCISPGTIPDQRLSWVVALLPYIEQENLFRQFNLEKGYAATLPAGKTRINMLMCPTATKVESRDAVTMYVAMSGIAPDAAFQPVDTTGNGFMGYDRLTSSQKIKDGSSNTIALMETRFDLGPWARGGTSTLRGINPDDLPIIGDLRPFGGHTRSMLAAMADGSVRTIRSSINPMQLAALITINGGEKVEEDP